MIIFAPYLEKRVMWTSAISFLRLPFSTNKTFLHTILFWSVVGRETCHTFLY